MFRIKKRIHVVGVLALLAGITGCYGCAPPQLMPQGNLVPTGFTPERAATPPRDVAARPVVPAIPQVSLAGPLSVANAPQGYPMAPAVPGAIARREPAPEPVAKTAPRTVLRVNTSNFEQHVLTASEPVLVDFYADWCGPCKALAPTLEQVAAENPHARVVKVNIDDSPELAARYGVKSVPRLLAFKNGQVAAQQMGVVSKTKLNAMLAL